MLLVTTSRRVVCALNGHTPYQTALLPVGDGRFVLRVNKKLRDALRLRFGSEVTVRLTPDTSEYGLPMPPELKEVFAQDPDGRKAFLGLTKGRQRTLLYIVGSVKDPEKRAFRAIIVARHLKENDGKIDYRRLDRMFKAHATRKAASSG
jgi:hypothetical protein